MVTTDAYPLVTPCHICSYLCSELYSHLYSGLWSPSALCSHHSRASPSLLVERVYTALTSLLCLSTRSFSSPAKIGSYSL
jgi:hypothetical protein